MMFFVRARSVLVFLEPLMRSLYSFTWIISQFLLYSKFQLTSQIWQIKLFAVSEKSLLASRTCVDSENLEFYYGLHRES